MQVDEVVRHDDQAAYGGLVEVKSGTDDYQVRSSQQQSKATSKGSQPGSRLEVADDLAEGKTPPKSVVYSRRHSANSRKNSCDVDAEPTEDPEPLPADDPTLVRPYVDQQRD